MPARLKKATDPPADPAPEPTLPEAIGGTAAPMSVRVERRPDDWPNGVHLTVFPYGHILVVNVSVEGPPERECYVALHRPGWRRQGSSAAGDNVVFHRIAVPAPVLTSPFEVSVIFGPDARRTVRLATVSGTHGITLPPEPGERSALLVSGIARGGTTLLMRTLAEHPEIACVQEYPYESRHAQYLVHHMLVGMAPSGPGSFGPIDLNAPAVLSGSNPFFDPSLKHADVLATESVELMAAQTKAQISLFYDRVSSATGHARSRYFVEKFPGVEQGTALRNLFPASREIFLIRDLRDVACSSAAMNERRGETAFGADAVGSQAEYLAHLSRTTLLRWRRYQRDVPEPERLVLRYEELVTRPADEIARLCAGLGIDDDRATIEAMVAAAIGDTGLQREHVTSKDVASSVGRWRTDLDAEAVAAAPEILADFDAAFGYPLADG